MPGVGKKSLSIAESSKDLLSSKGKERAESEMGRSELQGVRSVQHKKVVWPENPMGLKIKAKKELKIVDWLREQRDK